MKALPIGINEFGNIQFKVGEKLIQLGSTILDDLPEIAQGIEVGRHLTKIHFLHSTCFGGGRQKQSEWYVEDDTLIGEYRVNFEDRTAIIMPIVYGRDVKDWFYAEGDEAPTRSKVVWTGTNERSTEVSKKIRLYGSTWENPWPNKLVTTIDYSAKIFDTGAAPFCVAITVESKPPAK